ncbi:MAG: hypothetical protein JWM80_4713 [Cyanobacteria bacterium RYN_339]|nr:hypothetical protein [Cyanobacteria bacterium RYN_339]
MARKPVGARRLAFAAAVALGVAGAGTYAAMKAMHDDSADEAAAAMQRAAAPLARQLKTAPARVEAVAIELRKLPATVKAHSPARLVEQATQTISGPGSGAPRPAMGPARPHAPARPEWETHTLGRGVIIEHH